MSIEAMRQAFDFLHDLWAMRKTIRTDDHKKVMWDLERAIEQAGKQRPIGWWNGRETAWFEHESNGSVDDCTIPLYTTPPQREWVGLTDEEIDDIWDTHCDEMGDARQEYALCIARAIEAKLKEKNYGQPKRNTDMCGND